MGGFPSLPRVPEAVQGCVARGRFELMYTGRHRGRREELPAPERERVLPRIGTNLQGARGGARTTRRTMDDSTMRVGDDVMLSAQKVWTTLWWTTSETKLPAWWAERERERERGGSG